MPTEPVDSSKTPDTEPPQATDDVTEDALPVSEPDGDPGAENEPDDTPEYPMSAPMKPDDPERLTPQSKAETAGLVEEELTADPVHLSRTKASFRLAIGSGLLIAVSLGFELGRQVSQRR
jgi:hypothetical protein